MGETTGGMALNTAAPADENGFALPRAMSAEESARYQADGFLLLKNAFDPAAIAAIEAEIERLEKVPEAPGQHWVYGETVEDPEPRRVISRMENLVPFSPVFAGLSTALLGYAGEALGGPAALFKEKVNFKRPGGAGFTPHQDQQAGWWNYAPRFVSIMVCVDPATPESGCVEFAAGHHQRGMFREWEPLTDEDMKDMTFVPVATEPGDVVLIDSFCPHRSETNRSDRQRRLYFATYNRAADGDHLARYYADKHANYPPDVERAASTEYRFKV
ncbi:phytanoyl-CoA dioxygenase family protein [Stappia indica]|uniref:phytanoyl-CoA dioxygenase family protein n=1 Tax=Stappia indica TaxID=538381 RepID=UPI001CD23830|nr:phytanoyl-CoA dioxygenase family protein [Stappia indica]MCA1298153.1 phytanoyl-CoA dioxygenase family protein [Stappia indica]